MARKPLIRGTVRKFGIGKGGDVSKIKDSDFKPIIRLKPDKKKGKRSKGKSVSAAYKSMFSLK